MTGNGAEPTVLGAHVQCDDGEWVALFRDRRGQIIWLRIGYVFGTTGSGRAWDKLRNPRPVAAPPGVPLDDVRELTINIGSIDGDSVTLESANMVPSAFRLQTGDALRVALGRDCATATTDDEFAAGRQSMLDDVLAVVQAELNCNFVGPEAATYDKAHRQAVQRVERKLRARFANHTEATDEHCTHACTEVEELRAEVNRLTDINAELVRSYYALLQAVVVAERERDELRAENERLKAVHHIELDNHHNAAMCPYCSAELVKARERTTEKIRRLQAAVDAVRALHRPHTSPPDEQWQFTSICTCCRQKWPCGTIAALDAHLTGGSDD